MKRSTEKELLLAVVCATLYLGAFFLFIEPVFHKTHLGYFPALLLLLYFFGVITALLLFRRARWARVGIATIAFSAALILTWRTVQYYMVGLVLLRTPNSTVIIWETRMNHWEFEVVVVVLGIIAMGFGAIGLWSLEKRT
jgi:hypothetical protein